MSRSEIEEDHKENIYPPPGLFSSCSTLALLSLVSLPPISSPHPCFVLPPSPSSVSISDCLSVSLSVFLTWCFFVRVSSRTLPSAFLLSSMPSAFSEGCLTSHLLRKFHRSLPLFPHTFLLSEGRRPSHLYEVSPCVPCSLPSPPPLPSVSLSASPSLFPSLACPSISHLLLLSVSLLASPLSLAPTPAHLLFFPPPTLKVQILHVKSPGWAQLSCPPFCSPLLPGRFMAPTLHPLCVPQPWASTFHYLQIIYGPGHFPQPPPSAQGRDSGGEREGIALGPDARTWTLPLDPPFFLQQMHSWENPQLAAGEDSLGLWEQA